MPARWAGDDGSLALTGAGRAALGGDTASAPKAGRRPTTSHLVLNLVVLGVAAVASMAEVTGVGRGTLSTSVRKLVRAGRLTRTGFAYRLTGVGAEVLAEYTRTWGPPSGLPDAETARRAADDVAALAAAGVPVSEEHPVYVWRSDISAMLVWDGVKWAGTGGLTIETQQVGDTGLPYAAPAPNEIMLIKTGRLSSNTTNQFGNGYLPAVKFRAPFPRACLTVTVTPIYRNTKPWFFTDTRAPMIDVIDRNGFRAMYPGETTSVNHSIIWQAIGY